MKNANPWFVFVVLKKIYRCGASLLNRDCIVMVVMVMMVMVMMVMVMVMMVMVMMMDLARTVLNRGRMWGGARS